MQLKLNRSQLNPNVLVAFFYFLILIVGLILSFSIPEQTKEHQKKTVYFLNSKNLINIIFAYKGNLVWTFLFIYIALVQIFIHTRKFEVLPTVNPRRNILNSRFDNSRFVPIVKQYFVKFCLKMLILYLCFVVIDEIFILTGGQCTSGNENIGLHSAEGCRSTGGKWVGGFDISGHFCFLMNISLILWGELILYYRYIKEHSIEYLINKWVSRGLICIFGVLSIWSFLLCITSIYYHTVLEKILGCILGYSCYAIMYFIIPNNITLNKYLYN